MLVEGSTRGGGLEFLRVRVRFLIVFRVWGGVLRLGERVDFVGFGEWEEQGTR